MSPELAGYKNEVEQTLYINLVSISIMYKNINNFLCKGLKICKFMKGKKLFPTLNLPSLHQMSVY